jgi:hypothetical protein
MASYFECCDAAHHRSDTRTASFWEKKKEISACHYLPIVRSSTSLFQFIQFSSFYKLNLTDFGWSAQSISSLTGSFSRNGNA